MPFCRFALSAYKQGGYNIVALQRGKKKRSTKSGILICEKKICLTKFDEHGNSLYLLAKRRRKHLGLMIPAGRWGLELERYSTTRSLDTGSPTV
jgi:hypothetical protein